MRTIVKSYSLDAAGIDAISEALSAFFAEQKIDRRVALRARLALEEMLLRVMERDGAPEACVLTMGMRFGAVSVTVQYDGAALDPSGTADEWSARLLTNLGLAPQWSYRGGANVLRLRISKASGRGSLLWLLTAVAAALVLGVLGRWLPDSLRGGVTEALLTPVFNAFIGLLAMLAGPLNLFTVASGVFGIGDTRSLRTAGKTMFLRFLTTALIFSTCSALITAQIFPLKSAPSSGESQILAISQMLFGIVPSNPITPFYKLNIMQIIVMAVFLGVVLLMVGERAGTVARFVEEGSWVCQVMTGQVCRLMPVFVFSSLLRMIWSGSAVQLIGLWKPILLYLTLLVGAVAAELVTTCVRTKTPVGLLFRKELPHMIIAFTTASSMAAFETNVNACKKKLGVEEHFADFGIPVGTVVFMPSSAIALALFAIYLAHTYGVQADLRWYFMVCLLGAVLSIAAPPMAGAALTVNTIMLAQLGISAEGLLLVAAANVFMDFFDTAGNVVMCNLELVKQADILGKLDREVLHRP